MSTSAAPPWPRMRNKANAIKLLDYLVSEPAQALYAQANYEYPVRRA